MRRLVHGEKRVQAEPASLPEAPEGSSWGTECGGRICTCAQVGSGDVAPGGESQSRRLRVPGHPAHEEAGHAARRDRL
jgi:hypothetical protein